MEFRIIFFKDLSRWVLMFFGYPFLLVCYDLPGNFHENYGLSVYFVTLVIMLSLVTAL